MSGKETIEGLVASLDNEITIRNKGLQIVETDYPGDNGKIPANLYPEYRKRKDDVIQRFTERWIASLSSLNGLCKAIRAKQPDLCGISEDSLNTSRSFPRNIVLGRINVKYENLDIFVPRTVEFPIRKPVYIDSDKDNTLIHRLLLRLLYALPVSKTEIMVYDPNGLGSAVDIFRTLFSIESIFPHKKVLSTQKELKQMLTGALEYCERLIQNTFTKDSNCWADYNRLKSSQGAEMRKQMLPYKIFAFFNVPSGMDAECFDMFRKLTVHGQRLGVLVVFSYNPSELESDKSFQNSLIEGLNKFISTYSVPLNSVINVLSRKIDVDNLQLIETPERFPNAERVDELMECIIKAVVSAQEDSASFDGLMCLTDLFNGSTMKGISIPLGFNVLGGEKVSLELGDYPPHALIGGTSGSGKSTFLHNLILSACCRFSPNELNLYLLDFKSGVEFSVYATYKLPHARLVAVEADMEYGISVLKHLVDECKIRYIMFKKAGVSDISDYRMLNPDARLPRLLLVVDEFQELLSGKKNATEKAHEHLSLLVKQGRACGIHIVMATQTLAGLDFSALGTQFGARIALVCSEDDSKKIFGGLNNDAAAQLKPGYVILNTQAGAVSGNIKLAVPYARKMTDDGKDGNIRTTVRLLASKCASKQYGFETRIFRGMSMPQTPDCEEFTCDSVQLMLGEILSYESNRFYIGLERKAYNNLLVCGDDDDITNGLLTSMLVSAEKSSAVSKIIYVGDKLPLETDDYSSCTKLTKYDGLQTFLQGHIDRPDEIDKSTIIILRNVNAVKEIGYPSFFSGQNLSNEQSSLKTLLDDCNTHGVHIIAFYAKISQHKASGLPLERFDLRIGYLLNDADISYLLGQHLPTIGKDIKTGRAFFANNGEIVCWFKPFVGELDE